MTIEAQRHGRPVPASFVGLSLEYRAVLEYLGTNPHALNPVFLRLLANLVPGQTPVLRIGGDSTDWSWWPVPKMKRPPGITYNLTPTWLAVAQALAQDSRARYILGVNLEAGSRTIEDAEAHALLSGIGRSHIDALELGNEPELYSKLGWYRSGTSYIRGRPANYDLNSFASEVSSFRKAVAPVPVAGPSTGSFWWLNGLGSFLDDEPGLGMVTVHSYWLNHCLKDPSLAGYPSIPHLLAPFPPSRLSGALARYAALVHAHDIPIRIDEMNSVTCGGQNGVSDVFASALWAANALFEAASDGIDGVNIHTFPGTANQLFSFMQAAGHWTAAVRPEYYGLLLFGEAAPPGSQLLNVFQQNTDQLRVWATQGRDGTRRLLLINDSLTQTRLVGVHVTASADDPVGTAPAQLTRLLAPSALARSQITLGGQSFGAQTTTGALAGTSSVAPLPALVPSGGVPTYLLTVPPATAALITIPG